MQFDLIVLGLILDVVGFTLVFLFGGFSIGRVSIVAEDSKSHRSLKIIGAILVVLGFVLQLVGTLK